MRYRTRHPVAGIAILIFLLGFVPASLLFAEEAPTRSRPVPEAKTIVQVAVANDQVTLGFEDGTTLQVAREDLRIRDRSGSPAAKVPNPSARPIEPGAVRLEPEGLESRLQSSAAKKEATGIPVVVFSRLGPDGRVARVRVDIRSSLDDARAFVAAWSERAARHEKAGAGG